jgi:hypothetical protein
LGGKEAMKQLRLTPFACYKWYTNSIATIVKHLSGNMLSRWTDFLTTDGKEMEKS